MLDKILKREIDNSALIVFRILFGALIVFHSIKSLADGTVYHNFVVPRFIFTYIGFEFLEVFTGPPMYIIFVLMALCGLGIALGFRFRFSLSLLIILWGIVYLLDKGHHNNHHYLIWWIAFLMLFTPANRWRSLDVQLGYTTPKTTVPYFYILTLQVLVAVVYFYAAVAKLYPDWIQGMPVSRWLSYNDYNNLLWGDAFNERLRSILSKHSIHVFVAYMGIVFDFLIVPAFIWKRTRPIALIFALGFHLSNSFLFHIGIFPFLALSLFIFYYNPEFIRKRFLPNKPVVKVKLSEQSIIHPVVSVSLSLVMLFHIIFPLHHHIMPGDVLWTDGGHRHTWRMMLRTKTSEVQLFVVEPVSGKYESVPLGEYLMSCQITNLGYKADFQWQFAHHIEDIYKKKWNVDDLQLSYYAQVGVNGRELSLFTNKQYDVTSWQWKYFKQAPWLMPKPF